LPFLIQIANRPKEKIILFRALSQEVKKRKAFHLKAPQRMHQSSWARVMEGGAGSGAADIS